MTAPSPPYESIDQTLAATQEALTVLHRSLRTVHACIKSSHQHLASSQELLARLDRGPVVTSLTAGEDAPTMSSPVEEVL